MAKLDITLTKEKYDALSDELKTFYTANQEGGYELEGIGSIQRSLEAERKNKTKPELLEELEALRQFKADQEAEQKKAADADLEAKGKYDEALASKEQAWKERFDAEEASKNALMADIHRERLTNELIKRGVLADRAAYLVSDLMPETELYKHSDTGRYDLRKKGGIGDAAEFDKVMEGVKERVPFFFAATGAAGSGASQSTVNAGGVDLNSMTAEQMLDMANAATTK